MPRPDSQRPLEPVTTERSTVRAKWARGSWPPAAKGPAFPESEPRTGVLSAATRHLHGVRRFGRVSASSACMHEIFDVLERFAPTDVSLTLIGDTGTGKDVLAHSIHEESARAAGPFVVFDCGAVASNLAESELLGHERGAFTGALAAHPGAFERADGGTIFLDEIGELALDLQPRLLRALESRRVRRVGGKHERAVDVRVIAATNRDLRADVASGKFREDLYFRLAGAVINVPPLRQRLDDLALLVRGLLSSFGRDDVAVHDAALTALRAHAWSGNVRELKNTLACALAFVGPSGTDLREEHLRLQPGQCEAAEADIERLPLGGRTLEAIERAAIKQTLAQAEGNKASAARSLGIALSTLYEKLKRYDL
ncbi:MAG TPA: sigma-54 dependent transcriptional regulator [Polyangiaceae bacterium]|nr:sigma-54 dependent transcriptional regulator [Polyangiaceae bacterium]